ncbi:MAG: MBL fold metallo-hydrolase [bacterium]|nr:MBL fold metallo-hydrolase [bacterium]
MSEVVFIGTSDAFGAGGRRQSAVFARGERGGMLFDCGGTTNSGLTQLGIDREEIEVILISHFHGDHFGGIPAFLYASLYTDARKEPLEIVGPPEIEARVRALATALGHPLDGGEWSFPIGFHELHAGERRSAGPAQIEAFATQHQLESNPQGYRIQLGREKIAYSGDTGWFGGLPGHVAGSDLFICECTQCNAELDFHLSLEELREHRDDLDCGRLILTHLGNEMARERGQIEIETADDGMTVKL